MNSLLEAPAEPANVVLDPQRSIPSILVVEDDPDIRQINAEILNVDGGITLMSPRMERPDGARSICIVMIY